MPIYMDRHELSEAVTAEAVAKVHQEDLKIQDQYNCSVLTYWFDEKRKVAFCLIEAPEMNAVSEMHNKAHGMIPNNIIEVNNHVVNAFLGRIENPTFSGKVHERDYNVITESAFRIILISKISDYGIIKAKSEKDELESSLDIHNRMVRKAIGRCEGREVKHLREGFIISFSSISNALDFASEIQSNISRQNIPKFQIKIGISTGGPVTENPEFFGEAIHLAQRLCYVARNGHTLISSEIRAQMLEEFHTFVDKRMIFLDTKDEEFLNHLMEVSENYWNEPRGDVNSFGRKLGLSKAQLYRKLTKLCGYSPSDFIKEYRLRKAVESLENHQGNVAEVTYQSGFSSPSYFSKCFLERFGILPSVFAASIV